MYKIEDTGEGLKVWLNGHCHNMSYYSARQFSGIIRKLVEKHFNQKEGNNDRT